MSPGKDEIRVCGYIYIYKSEFVVESDLILTILKSSLNVAKKSMTLYLFSDDV